MHRNNKINKIKLLKAKTSAAPYISEKAAKRCEYESQMTSRSIKLPLSVMTQQSIAAPVLSALLPRLALTPTRHVRSQFNRKTTQFSVVKLIYACNYATSSIKHIHLASVRPASTERRVRRQRPQLQGLPCRLCCKYRVWCWGDWRRVSRQFAEIASECFAKLIGFLSEYMCTRAIGN